MLLCFFVADDIAVEEHVHIFPFRMLRAVAVELDYELFVSTLRAVRRNLVCSFVLQHNDGGCVSCNFGAVGKPSCRGGLRRADSGDVKTSADGVFDKRVVGCECRFISVSGEIPSSHPRKMRLPLSRKSRLYHRPVGRSLLRAHGNALLPKG